MPGGVWMTLMLEKKARLRVGMGGVVGEVAVNSARMPSTNRKAGLNIALLYLTSAERRTHAWEINTSQKNAILVLKTSFENSVS